MTLQEILVAHKARRTRPIPGRLREFFQDGVPGLYRISRAGDARPLSIGLTMGRRVVDRLIEHYRRPKRGDRRVYEALQGHDPAHILVQVSHVRRPDLDPRLNHAYEIWLQKRERTQLYNPRSLTFEEEEL